jgi:hypothetical protein
VLLEFIARLIGWLLDLVAYIIRLTVEALWWVIGLAFIFIPVAVSVYLMSLVVKRVQRGTREHREWSEFRRGQSTPRSGGLATIMVNGVRSEDSAVVELPAELVTWRVEAFIVEVMRWAGPGCRRIYFCRGSCSCVDEVGLALSRRGWNLSWVADRAFAQNGWLAEAY